MTSTARIRDFRPGDEDALARICVLTADAGGDATGVLVDDDIWPAVFALPYVARHPDFAFVVETENGRVAGYIVCAPDTDAFEAWFREEWWPRFANRWPEPLERRTRTDDILAYAYGRGPSKEPEVARYPAHLHIDLLPELQGLGWGRRLIEALADRLRTAGVRGVHLVAVSDNAGALAFYPRVGFEPLESEPGVQAFGMRLAR